MQSDCAKETLVRAGMKQPCRAHQFDRNSQDSPVIQFMITNLIVTAYCLCSHCCPVSNGGIAANNHKPIAGITIAASRRYPFGTKVVIDGHTYTVQDRLAKRYDDRIDIFMSSHKKAKDFGIKRKTVNIHL